MNLQNDGKQVLRFCSQFVQKWGASVNSTTQGDPLWQKGPRVAGSMHFNELGLGSATLLQLVFLWESDPNFPTGEIPIGTTKWGKKKKKKKKNQYEKTHHLGGVILSIYVFDFFFLTM